MFNFFGKSEQPANETTPAEYSAERMIELVSDNDELAKAVEDYSRLLQQVEWGGAVLSDRPLLEAAEAKITELLAKDGKALEFKAAPHTPDVNDSLSTFVKLYKERYGAQEDDQQLAA